MRIEVRSTWSVMYSAIVCLVIRDIQNKFINNVRSTRAFGFIWIFLTPLMHIAIWICIRQVLGNAASELPLPLFILLGVMPFMLFSNSLRKCPTQIAGNRGAYMFRQIKPIDTIIALIISEFLVLVANYLLLLIFFWWINIKWTLYNPFMLFEAFFSFTIFMFGIAFILSVAGFFILFIRRFLPLLIRFSYLMSGVFMPESMLPEPIRFIMSYNPLFQCIALSRQAFSASIPFQSLASQTYLWLCALFSLFLGLLIYLSFSQKIMQEIEQH